MKFNPAKQYGNVLYYSSGKSRQAKRAMLASAREFLGDGVKFDVAHKPNTPRAALPAARLGYWGWKYTPPNRTRSKGRFAKDAR